MVDGQAHEDLGTVGLIDMRDEGLESLRLVLVSYGSVERHGRVMGSSWSTAKRMKTWERSA